MRKSIRDFIIMVNKTLILQEPIYEFGARQVEDQEELADLRSIFEGKEYVGCDIQKGKGVDLVLDLHNIHLPEASVSSILCLDTLEHVEYPHRALEEIYRVLTNDGIVIISSTMVFGIHNQPDYWRFSPEGFKSLLKPFARSFVGYAGDRQFPHVVIGIGWKGDLIKEHYTYKIEDLTKFLKGYEEWRKNQAMVLIKEYEIGNEE